MVLFEYSYCKYLIQNHIIKNRPCPKLHVTFPQKLQTPNFKVPFSTPQDLIQNRLTHRNI